MTIEPKEGEEILRITDRDGYTEVVKRFEDQSGAYLYHVTPEPHPGGEDRLNWTLIGRVESDDP